MQKDPRQIPSLRNRIITSWMVSVPLWIVMIFSQPLPPAQKRQAISLCLWLLSMKCLRMRHLPSERKKSRHGRYLSNKSTGRWHGVFILMVWSWSTWLISKQASQMRKAGLNAIMINSDTINTARKVGRRLWEEARWRWRWFLSHRKNWSPKNAASPGHVRVLQVHLVPLGCRFSPLFSPNRIHSSAVVESQEYENSSCSCYSNFTCWMAKRLHLRFLGLCEGKLPSTTLFGAQMGATTSRSRRQRTRIPFSRKIFITSCPMIQIQRIHGLGGEMQTIGAWCGYANGMCSTFPETY